MTEEQGNRIIELLEELLDRVNEIESNISDLSKITSRSYILDDISDSLQNIESNS